MELLAHWSAGEGPAHAGWDGSFGDAYGALQAHDATNVLPLAIRMALHLGSRGLAGSWRGVLPRPLPLRWGPWSLPPGGRIAVESDGGAAKIRVSDDSEDRAVVLLHGEDGWRAEGAEILPRFGRHGAVVLPRHLLVLHGFDELVAAAADSIEPRLIATLDRSIEIIADHAPAYLSWVERVVHETFLIKPRVRHIQSGSIAKYFGLVHVSAASDPTAIAELFVHEASHQYFHLLCLLGPCDDGSDTNQYYSPAVRTDRSLARIAVAYHAFANILLFYDACLASGIDDGGYCRRGREALAPQVDQLAAPLRGNRALTSIGRALCEPLLERLGR
jgi:HEXXH motif-containing protein